MTNCVVFGNNASQGGGIYAASSPLSVLENCSIVGNFAISSGGGIWGGILTNCVAYYNSVGASSSATNIANTTAVYNCCTLPTNGLGAHNISSPPGFVNIDAGDLHLAPWSPCIDAGNNAAIIDGTDLDGNPRMVNGNTDIGAFEFQNKFFPIVHYVNLRNSIPVSPFTSWDTAATNIQDAIDASVAGDYVLVSNGTYNVGGRAIYGLQANRVAVDKMITVQSLAGANYTTIAGGASGPRCVYLTNGAALIGFTLINGGARFSGESTTNQNGGGAWCESPLATLSNCIFASDSAANFGGGAYSGTLVNCVIESCRAIKGGGSYNSILVSCSLSNNMAISGSSSLGGGSFGGLLMNCILTKNYSLNGGGACSNVAIGSSFIGNWVSKSGGGAYSCFLTNCILSGNLATNSGGGAVYGVLTSCTITTNLAPTGGGACSNSLLNCALTGNRATTNGGGAAYCNISDCAILGNVASNFGGGAFWSYVTNCTVISNNAVFGGGMAGGYGSNCLVSYNVATLGGGVYSNVLFRSIISGNASGGSYYSTLNACQILYNRQNGSQNDFLNNCLVSGNAIGGASGSGLCNCTVVQNGLGNPFNGFGVSGGTLTNCIVYSNPQNVFSSLVDHCCTTPLYPGNSNISNAPVFLDSEYHLASNSPCIGAGNNVAVSGATDLDGRPRIVGGTVDIGASEFQGVNVEPFISWLARYGLPLDGSADNADSDGTGMSNWQKWIAGLNPTNRLSILAMSFVAPTNISSGLAVTWKSVTNVTYYLLRSSDLEVFTPVQSNLLGHAGVTVFTDTTATNAGPYFYRVGVQY